MRYDHLKPVPKPVQTGTTSASICVMQDNRRIRQNLCFFKAGNVLFFCEEHFLRFVAWRFETDTGGLGGERQTLERQSQKAESIVGWSAGAVRRRGPNRRDSSHV